MARLVPDQRFNKAVAKLTRRDDELLKSIGAAMKRFEANPRHPGLNFEKIINRSYWTIRVGLSIRIALRPRDGEPDTFDLIDIGNHDDIYRRHE